MPTTNLDDQNKTTMDSGWTPKPPSGAQADGGVTYARQRIFVKKIWGQFQQYRWVTFAFFTAVFAILPWLRWGERRAVLFDIPTRKFYIFNVVVWPQEFYLLTASMLLGAMALFFLTTLVGRMWCGYMCPQTVVTNLFLVTERWIEGDRIQQQKLAAAPWSAAKVGKLAAKHVIWLALSFFFGFTFVSYFVPQNELWTSISHLTFDAAMMTFLFVAGFTLFDGGYFREQMCLVPCPYGRFQGAMIDRNSLMVVYDTERGEPRGKAAPNNSVGDCVNCQLCVQVCPTGIDIRNGVQYECITCASCIDACDQVMTKLHRPTGLIRYSSLAQMEKDPPVKFRFRPVLYGSILTVVGILVLGYMVTRPEYGLDVIRDRAALATALPDGRFSNLYTLKLLNKDEHTHRYRVTLAGLAATTLPGEIAVQVPAGEVVTQTVSVIVPADTQPGAKKFAFEVTPIDDKDAGTIQTKSTFFVPFHEAGEHHEEHPHHDH